MAALIVASAMLALAQAPPAEHPVPSSPPAVARWDPYIAEASLRFGIPERWIAAVMQAESAGLTMLEGRPIVSRAGAMGLMQLMPETWAELRNLHRLGSDPFDPHDNILAGAAYLRAMYERFGYPGLFAAYNAGPDRYSRHLVEGKPLPAETRSYIAGLAQTTPMSLAAMAPFARLFSALDKANSAAGKVLDSSDRRPAANGIFVPLKAAGRAPK